MCIRDRSGKGVGEIEIVSTSLQKEAVALRDGSESDASRIFGNQVELERLLKANSGKLTISNLFTRLREIGQEIQSAAVRDVSATLGAGASIESLSEARNSLLLRWQPEALSAIQDSYAIFVNEMRHSPYVARTPSAYELMEGKDQELRTLFASFCGLRKAALSMNSSSKSLYVSRHSVASNAAFVRIALAKLVRRATTYGMNNGMGSSRKSYFG